MLQYCSQTRIIINHPGQTIKYQFNVKFVVWPPLLQKEGKVKIFINHPGQITKILIDNSVLKMVYSGPE
jgi:hypothetical protein